MKIQCDVCEKEEAAVYCTADEAALCDTCDHRVHHANKLASKHFRFSLLLPDPKSFPLCDVCQEKRAFVFCQQDRAILCQDCDVPIHTANEFTHHHNRFLLTGVKLSQTSQIYISPSDAATNLVPCITAIKSTMNKPVSLSLDVANPNTHGVQAASVKNSTAINNSNNRVGDNNNNNNNNNGNSMLMTGVGGGYGSVHSSSISEYLIDMLPGWHVEDFLQPPPPSSTPFGFSEPNEHGAPSFMAVGGNLISPFSSESSGIWVPQAQTPHSYLTHDDQMQKNGFKDTKNHHTNNNKGNRRWTLDDVFAVPEMSSPPSTASKRSRLLWQ